MDWPTLTRCRSVDRLLGLSDDEALPRSLHDSFAHLSQRLDFENSCHLREEAVQQPEVASRDRFGNFVR